MEEFSKPVYKVDVLKVEFPVVAGDREWPHQQALEWYRAAWQDGVPVHAREGRRNFSEWLASEGVRHQQAINRRLESAVSWETRR